MPQREPGFYWVKQRTGHRDDVELIVAQMYLSREGAELWLVPGSDEDHNEADFNQIGPRIEPPLQFHREAFAMIYPPLGEPPKE